MKFTAIHTINLPDRLVVPGEVFEYDEAAAANLVRIGACSKVEAPVVEAVAKIDDGDDSLGLDDLVPAIVKGKKGR